MRRAVCKVCQRNSKLDFWGHCATCAELRPLKPVWSWLDWLVAGLVIGLTLYWIWRTT